MNTVEVVIRSVKSFYVELCLDKNGRYRSWEHCYKVFHDARKTVDPDIDYLSLHLAFYLASWGKCIEAHPFYFRKIIKCIFL